MTTEQTTGVTYEVRLTVNGVVTLCATQTFDTVEEAQEEIERIGDPAGYADYIRNSDRFGTMAELLTQLGCPGMAAPYVWGLVVEVAR